MVLALLPFPLSQRFSSTAQELQASWDRRREMTCPRSSFYSLFQRSYVLWAHQVSPWSPRSAFGSRQGGEDILSGQLDSPQKKKRGTWLAHGSSLAVLDCLTLRYPATNSHSCSEVSQHLICSNPACLSHQKLLCARQLVSALQV